MQTTRLSSKGQIIIPQTIREAHHWHTGVEFVVTELDQGILLTPIKPFKKTTVQTVLGCASYKGRKKSLKDMQAGIIKGAKRNK